MNKMKLVIGDWSDDGHGKHFDITLECNYTVKEIQDAYKLSVIQTGLGFDNSDCDENGNKLHDVYQICTEYEAGGTLTLETLEILKQFGCPDDLILDYQEEPMDNFVKLWFWFVSLSLSNLKYKLVKDDVPTINGYWNKNLNTQFGYGLFI